MKNNKHNAFSSLRVIALTGYLIVSANTAFSQVNLDSLWTVWNDTSQADTIRLIAIHDLAWDGYLFSQPDSAFYFAQLQYNFAKSKGQKKQMALSLKTQGVSFYYQGDYTSAIDYYTRSLTIQEEIGDKKGMASSLNNIGIVYYLQGDHASAIDHYTRCLTLFEEIGNKKGIASSLNNIGLIYEEQGDNASALDNYDFGKAQESLKALSDKIH